MVRAGHLECHLDEQRADVHVRLPDPPRGSHALRRPPEPDVHDARRPVGVSVCSSTRLGIRGHPAPRRRTPPPLLHIHRRAPGVPDACLLPVCKSRPRPLRPPRCRPAPSTRASPAPASSAAAATPAHCWASCCSSTRRSSSRPSAPRRSPEKPVQQHLPRLRGDLVILRPEGPERRRRRLLVHAARRRRADRQTPAGRRHQGHRPERRLPAGRGHLRGVVRGASAS